MAGRMQVLSSEIMRTVYISACGTRVLKPECTGTATWTHFGQNFQKDGGKLLPWACACRTGSFRRSCGMASLLV